MELKPCPCGQTPTKLRAKELREERDYTSVLSDALDALKNVPPGECSEEVQETLNAVIEDVSDVLVWFRCG